MRATVVNVFVNSFIFYLIGRQRLSSLSEDGSSVPLLARAQWGVAAAAAGASSAGSSRGTPQAALYLLTAGGALAHLMLHPRPANSK